MFALDCSGIESAKIKKIKFNQLIEDYIPGTKNHWNIKAYQVCFDILVMDV